MSRFAIARATFSLSLFKRAYILYSASRSDKLIFSFPYATYAFPVDTLKVARRDTESTYIMYIYRAQFISEGRRRRIETMKSTRFVGLSPLYKYRKISVAYDVTSLNDYLLRVSCCCSSSQLMLMLMLLLAKAST